MQQVFMMPRRIRVSALENVACKGVLRKNASSLGILLDALLAGFVC
jgi:hypothetical protein